MGSGKQAWKVGQLGEGHTEPPTQGGKAKATPHLC